MKTIVRLLFLCIAATAVPGTAPARANPAERLDKPGQICATETARMERRAAIPRHLLTAIALAESGRWDDASRANVAWPWTVTAEGRGRYFDTRAEALAEVELLMTRGVRNIDVGCMQVNLFYHGDAFDDLDEAFDPRANTAYAATYLRNMHQVTGNWLQAAGFYHSTTPERNAPYMRKVLGFWRQQGGAMVAERYPGGAESYVPAAVDYLRMARLNARFRADRDGDRPLDGAPPGHGDLQSQQSDELDAWRDASRRGLGVAHLAAMRQAKTELKRRRALKQMANEDPDARFATRRMKQLRDWRMRVAGSDPAVAVAATPASARGAGWTAAVEPVTAR